MSGLLTWGKAKTQGCKWDTGRMVLKASCIWSSSGPLKSDPPKWLSIEDQNKILENIKVHHEKSFGFRIQSWTKLLFAYFVKTWTRTLEKGRRENSSIIALLSVQKLILMKTWVWTNNNNTVVRILGISGSCSLIRENQQTV